MPNINNIEELNVRVAVLQQQREVEWKRLKKRIGIQYEMIKPSNMLRNAFEGMAIKINPDSDILQEGASIAAGIIVNSVMGNSKNKTLKRWLTIIAVHALTYIVTTYREEILAAGNKMINYVSDRLKRAKEMMSDKETNDDAVG